METSIKNPHCFIIIFIIIIAIQYTYVVKEYSNQVATSKKLIVTLCIHTACLPWKFYKLAIYMQYYYYH